MNQGATTHSSERNSFHSTGESDPATLQSSTGFRTGFDAGSDAGSDADLRKRNAAEAFRFIMRDFIGRIDAASRGLVEQRNSGDHRDQAASDDIAARLSARFAGLERAMAALSPDSRTLMESEFSAAKNSLNTLVLASSAEGIAH